jgi:hypothetical protein
MKSVRRIASFLAVSILASIPASAQPERVVAAARGDGKLEAAQLVKIEAKVEAIDLANREVTLKAKDGRVETVKVSEQVKNLAQVKAGDTVTVNYYESLTMSLNKTEGAVPVAAEAATEETATEGELPGGLRTREIAVVAKITAIDAKANTATLTGPKGNSVVLEVDPEVLTKVKVGDLVNAVYREALAVEVTRATP